MLVILSWRFEDKTDNKGELNRSEINDLYNKDYLPNEHVQALRFIWRRSCCRRSRRIQIRYLLS